MRRAFIPTFHWQPEPNERSTAYADDDERDSTVIPDIVLASGTLSVAELQKISRTLPIVFAAVEMLREDARDLKREDEFEPLDRVLGAGRHLLALINDILDLSKIEAGRMELQLESFALAPLIANVVKTIEPLAAKNANQVAVHCDDAIGMVHADQMRLRQALLNLMSNANKFTDHGTITIDARQGQESSRGSVTHLGGRHWYRHDAGADGQAVPGVFPGFFCDGE
jgi:signal transduction histidine kinase